MQFNFTTVKYNAMQIICNTVIPHNTVRCNTIQFNTIQCDAIQMIKSNKGCPK